MISSTPPVVAATTSDGLNLTRPADIHVPLVWLGRPGHRPTNRAPSSGPRGRSLEVVGVQLVGSWEGTRLVALGSLESRPVTDDPKVLKLDMLYVSADHRRRGIGRGLIELLADRARESGAIALYISATPTRSTVDAYLHLGAVVADRPRPIFARARTRRR